MPRQQIGDRVHCVGCNREMVVSGRYGRIHTLEGVVPMVQGYIRGWATPSCGPCEDNGTIQYCAGCDGWDVGYVLDDWDNCEPCAEMHSECDACGYMGMLESDLCEECEYEGGESYDFNGLRDYHDNPPMEFYDANDIVNYIEKPGKYYMGVEIELEDAVDIVAPVIPEFPRLWASHDGSLGSQGVEIISHPGTLAAWNDGTMIDWDHWVNEIHDKVPSQIKYKSNGIHVHVSRTAFNNPKTDKHSAAHLYRFMMFIQWHQQAVQYVANRKGSAHYCKWNGKKDIKSRKEEAEVKSGYTDRYRPINTNNRATIELRMFNGRSDPAFIMRCIQFTASVVEYTRHRSGKDGLSWEGYVRYVLANAKDYDALAMHLMSARKTLTTLAKNARGKWKTTVANSLRKDRLDRQKEEKRVREFLARQGPCDCRMCEQRGAL